MKKMLLVLFFAAIGFVFAQQGKKPVSEKDLAGDWSINKSPHALMNISGTESILTYILKNDHKVKAVQLFTRNGKEIVTTTESGIWKFSGKKLSLNLSGKISLFHSGTNFTGDKNAISKIGSSSGLNEKETNELKMLTAKARTIELYLNNFDDKSTLCLSDNEKGNGPVLMFEKTFGDPTIIDVPKGDLSGEEKNLIGRWSFNNPNHMLKEQIKDSESIVTFDLQNKRVLVFNELHKQKEKELSTMIENGTWGIKNGKLILHYSGKWITTRGGKEVPGMGMKPGMEQPRVIKYYYKIDGKNLLLSIHKDDFSNASKFVKD